MKITFAYPMLTVWRTGIVNLATNARIAAASTPESVSPITTVLISGDVIIVCVFTPDAGKNLTVQMDLSVSTVQVSALKMLFVTETGNAPADITASAVSASFLVTVKMTFSARKTTSVKISGALKPLSAGISPSVLLDLTALTVAARSYLCVVLMRTAGTTETAWTASATTSNVGTMAIALPTTLATTDFASMNLNVTSMRTAETVTTARMATVSGLVNVVRIGTVVPVRSVTMITGANLSESVVLTGNVAMTLSA